MANGSMVFSCEIDPSIYRKARKATNDNGDGDGSRSGSGRGKNTM